MRTHLLFPEINWNLITRGSVWNTMSWKPLCRKLKLWLRNFLRWLEQENIAWICYMYCLNSSIEDVYFYLKERASCDILYLNIIVRNALFIGFLLLGILRSLVLSTSRFFPLNSTRSCYPLWLAIIRALDITQGGSKGYCDWKTMFWCIWRKMSCFGIFLPISCAQQPINFVALI